MRFIIGPNHSVEPICQDPSWPPSDSLDRLTVPQLKKILKSKGLPVSGNKALLQKRLKEADYEEQRRESIPSSTGVFRSCDERTDYQVEQQEKTDMEVSMEGSGSWIPL